MKMLAAQVYMFQLQICLPPHLHANYIHLTCVTAVMMVQTRLSEWLDLYVSSNSL